MVIKVFYRLYYNAKECLNYHTVVLISHTSKVMLKIPKPGFNST